MILFVLGRQPEIGIAELKAVFSNLSRPIKGGQAGATAPLGGFYSPSCSHIAALDIPMTQALARLPHMGSVVKASEVVATLPQLNHANLSHVIKQLFGGIEGKITLGVSFYGDKISKKSTIQLAQDVERILKPTNSVRLVPVESNELSSAAVLHNKLAGDNPKKCELIFVKQRDGSVVVGRTFFVQDINAYTFRDRRRPKRDAHNGMLPPKLAQTMINLAWGAATPHPVQAPTLLDPFCGTGVVLQEAALMGMTVYGTDLAERMTEFTTENLKWLEHTHHIKVDYKVSAADATTFDWNKWINTSKTTPPSGASASLPAPTGAGHQKSAPPWLKGAGERSETGGSSTKINLVATETYLGRPYATAPSMTELHNNIGNCNVVIQKFLSNLSKQLSKGAGLCVAVPCWFVHGKLHHLACLGNLSAMGYRDLYAVQHLIYHRKDQVVGRELLVLQKA